MWVSSPFLKVMCSSYLRLLPLLPVTYIPPFIFPSITCRRRQFLRKLWPIQLAFRLRISCRIFLCSLILSNTWITFLNQKIFLFLRNSTMHHVSFGTKEGPLSHRSVRICLGDNDASWLSRRNEETQADALKEDVNSDYTKTWVPSSHNAIHVY
jgi:hypothetical protein